jgi:hypothetical protein
MRVCQFRHFGTHVKSSTDDWTGSLTSVAKGPPCVKQRLKHADLYGPEANPLGMRMGTGITSGNTGACQRFSHFRHLNYD